MDEARIGQKGRNGHRWWPKGERAPGFADERFVFHLPLCVRPATDDAFALVLPEANANTMDIFLDRFIACLVQNTHAPREGARGCRWEEPSTASKAGVFLFLGRLL